MSKSCIINPINNKASSLADIIGPVAYQQIVEKYYDIENPDFVRSFNVPNASPVFNPVVMDKFDDFKLFNHTTEKVTKTLTKHIYTPTTNISETPVIVPVKTLSHIPSIITPYVVGVKGEVTRIESFSDIGVSINNILETTDSIEETDLDRLSTVLKTEPSTMYDAIVGVMNTMSDRRRALLEQQLIDKLTTVQKMNMSRKDLLNLAIHHAMLSKDSNLKRALDNFLKPVVRHSVASDSVNNVIALMNSEAKHNESIMTDVHGRVINPLTGQHQLHHEYFLLRDADGNALKSPKRIETSVTNEIDIGNPYNRYRKILDGSLGKDRWKYLSDYALELIIKKSNEYNIEDIVINPYEEFDGKTDRSAYYTKFSAKPFLRDIIKAIIDDEVDANGVRIPHRNVKQSAFKTIKEFALKTKMNKGEFNTLLNSIIGMKLVLTKDIASVGFNDLEVLDLNSFEQEHTNKHKNLVDKLRGLNFGTIAGTYVHGIKQASMLAFAEYDGDFNKLISENSDESDKYHEFVEFAKEIVYFEDNDEVSYNKLKPLIDSAKTTIDEFMALAADKYSDGVNTKPKIYFENLVLTRNYGSFLAGRNTKKNRTLASKIDVTVVFPNGKVFIIDIKSSSKDNIRASSMVDPGSVNRYNEKIDEELDLVNYKGESFKAFRTTAEGYIQSEQTKHAKQLELYRKILIDRGIDPSLIETYIYFTAVEAIDKSKAIVNTEKGIDNVIDSIGRMVVPNFLEKDGVRANRSRSYETEPMSHMIPGDTLNNHQHIRGVIDNMIGLTTEEHQRIANRSEFTREMSGEGGSTTAYATELSAIKANIIKYMEATENSIKTVRTSKEEGAIPQMTDAEKRDKLKLLKQLRVDFDSISNSMAAVINFVEYAFVELEGHGPNEIGLAAQLKLEIESYNQIIDKNEADPFDAMNNSISRVQFIHDIIYKFKVLKEIKDLKELSGDLLFDKVQEQKLDSAILSYETSMKRYDRSYLKMLAKVLNLFHDPRLDEDYNIKLQQALNKGMLPDPKTGIINFTAEDLVSYKQAIENGEDVTAGVKHNRPFGHINAIYDDLNHLNTSEESIESELETLTRDIGPFAMYVMGAGMQNNRSLQLVNKMLKETTAKAELKTRKEFTELDKAFNKFRDTVGSSSDMEALFGELLERKSRKRYDNETGTLLDEDVWQFLSEYDSDYMLERDELTRQKIDAMETGNKRKERELAREIKQWELDNLQKLYKDVIYDIDDILDTPINGVAGVIRQKVDFIDNKMFDIQSKYSVNNPSHYTNEDRKDLLDLHLEKRLLASKYDKFGNMKTGDALEIATIYSDYKTKRGETITSTMDDAAYNKAFSEAKVTFKNDPVMLQRWLDTNSDMVLSDKYYAERTYLMMSKSIVWTMFTLDGLANKTDEEVDRLNDLTNKYRSELLATGDNDHEAFVNNMTAFLFENNIELVKSTDEATLKTMELTNPYKDSKGHTQYDLLPPEIRDLIKAANEERADELLKQFIINKKPLPKIETSNRYAAEYRQISEHLRNLEQYTVRSDYYDKIDRLLEYHDGDMAVVKETAWWKKNHTYNYRFVHRLSKDEDFDVNQEGLELLTNINSDAYLVYKEEVPINIWTIATPKSQKTFSADSTKINTLLGFVNKHGLSDFNIRLVSKGTIEDPTTPVPKDFNLSEIVTALRSEEGIKAIKSITRYNTTASNRKFEGRLDIKESSIAIDGVYYNVMDVLDGFVDVLRNEFLTKEVTAENQNDINLLDDYTTDYESEEGIVNFKLSRKLIEVENENESSYQRRPNVLYNRIKTKPEFFKPEAELRKSLTDSSFADNDRENGDIRYEDIRTTDALPLKEKWTNDRYAKMMSDNSERGKAVREFYNTVTEYYLSKQANYPSHKRRGLILPSRRKSTNETMLNKSSRTTLLSQAKRKAGDLFKKAEDDIEEEGNLDEDVQNQSGEFYGSSYGGNSINIPTMYVQNMNADDVSLDIMSSLQHFGQAANKYEALSSIVDTVRMLNTAVGNREDADKVIERDNEGRMIVSKLGEVMGAKNLLKFKGMSETSNFYKFFNDFLQQQFSGITNVPSYLTPNFRIDKLIDATMLLQSKASIGGLSPMAGIKGVVNALQASMSVAIEAAAGEYFTAHTMKKVLGLKQHSTLFADQAKEMYALSKGSTVSVTHTGHLMDHYDPLQGNFADTMGNNVSSKALPKLFKSSTWFFYQYFGEYLNSMTVLNAFLEERRILDDGTVITWKEYSKSPRLRKMNKADYRAERTSFRKRPSLRESLKQNDEGTALIITDVVTPGGTVTPKWVLGSKEDIQIRLEVQAISREINGAYAGADRTMAQKYWWGRALIMYKKHLVPSMVRRFGNNSGLASEELGSIRVGYHSEHYKKAGSAVYNFIINKQKDELRDLMKLYGSILTGGYKGDLAERQAAYIDENGKVVGTFTLSQIANIRKSLFEHMMLLTMAVLLSAIDIDDDEDKKAVSDYRWLTLYMLDKLRKEQNSLAISLVAGSDPISDNWKNLSSPSAIIKVGQDVIDLVSLSLQHTSSAIGLSESDKLYYKTASGIAEKGDSKFLVKLQKVGKNLIPLTPFVGQTPRSLYENMQMKN